WTSRSDGGGTIAQCSGPLSIGYAASAAPQSPQGGRDTAIPRITQLSSDIIRCSASPGAPIGPREAREWSGSMRVMSILAIAAETSGSFQLPLAVHTNGANVGSSSSTAWPIATVFQLRIAAMVDRGSIAYNWRRAATLRAS